MEEISKERMVSYIAILLLICICSFLTAKYFIRRGINEEEIPIDTSERIE